MRSGIDQESLTPPPHQTSPRESAQSALLVWSGCTLLGLCAIQSLLHNLQSAPLLRSFAISLLISAVFASIVWRLRAATRGGVLAGALVCLVLLLPPAPSDPDVRYYGLFALISLFIISFLATRFGQSHKEARGLAESRHGRQASQIVANLAAAAVFAHAGYPVGCVAAFAQAAADTSSSEIGQAIGGTVRMVTTWRRVPSGTDGGITFWGTCAGIFAAAIVTAVGSAGHLTWQQALIAFIAAIAGLFFDSLLGATVERRGWLYNDLVNFTSTVFAAILATALI